eukprot:jgi/Chlat1/7210/Chrsp57S06759
MAAAADLLSGLWGKVWPPAPAAVAILVWLLIRMLLIKRRRNQPPPPPGAVRAIHSKAEWDEALKEAKTANKLVIVDFTAAWCGPCRVIAPKYSQLSEREEYKETMFLKVDVDEVKEVAQQCGVSCMPTFQFFRAGQRVDTLEGANLARLVSLLTKHQKRE